MGAVSNLLDSKGHDVLTVRPDQPVHEAIEKMEDLHAGTSVVMDGGEVVGIVSERDVFRKVVLQGRSIDDVLVQDIMSTNLTTRALLSVGEAQATLKRGFTSVREVSPTSMYLKRGIHAGKPSCCGWITESARSKKESRSI